MKNLKVGLILKPDNKSWIIEKIAARLQEHLPTFGFDAEIAEQPLIDSNVIHHLSWAFANISSNVPSTMFITHLDDIYKLQQVKKELNSYVDIGICMSSDTVRLLKMQGIKDSSLCYISPAHDALGRRKRLVIGITTRIYSDGRKREDLLVRLSREIRLDTFEFRIFGKGWEKVIVELEKAGASVIYFRESNDYISDYKIILDEIPRFDYYLYLGMDEGSLGTLDALAAGVKTIVTPQGFHLDIPNGITHPITTYNELLEIFKSLSRDHFSRENGVANLTWREYAKRHSIVWKHLLSKKSEFDIQHLLEPETKTSQFQKSDFSVGGSLLNIYLRSFKPRRVVSAMSRLRIFKNVRNLLLHKGFKF